MKRRRERRSQWGEGWLMAGAFVLVLALCLGVYWNRLPRVERVQPVHVLSEEALARVEMVNLNTADAAELKALPGIGDALAQRIVDYRQAHGAFAHIEEIMNVPGIGEGKFQALREQVYVDAG